MGRIGPAILLTITTYLVLAAVFGPRGIIAHHHRGAYHASLERNLERLRERRDELGAEVERLQQDPDAITVAAREQLVLETNERLIRVKDDSGRVLFPTAGSGGGISPGSVLRRQQPFPDYSPVLRGVAASVGLAAYVFALGLKERPSTYSRRSRSRAREASRTEKTQHGGSATGRRGAARSPEHLSNSGATG